LASRKAVDAPLTIFCFDPIRLNKPQCSFLGKHRYLVLLLERLISHAVGRCRSKNLMEMAKPLAPTAQASRTRLGTLITYRFASSTIGSYLVGHSHRRFVKTSFCEVLRIGAPLFAIAWDMVKLEIAKKRERHARVKKMGSMSLYKILSD